MSSGFAIERVDDVTPELVDAFARLFPQLTRSVPTPDAEDLEDILASKAVTLLVARDVDERGPIVGTLALVAWRVPSGTHAYIEDVVVDKSTRGRGIGEALTREALRIAVQKGAGAVSLTSGPEREAANRLYRRLGFELGGGTNYYSLEL